VDPIWIPGHRARSLFLGRIRILDEVVANQIAAGEVVERPASVAKELIENALDAQASTIEIHIDGGGVQRLVVQDDGEGMLAEDAMLCFSRHATSKVEKLDDLSSLGTFGFRGEAIPSIASVAEVDLTTRARGESAGTHIQVSAGKVVKVGERGAVPGTRMEVKDLFFNVPARRKFLRQKSTETRSVLEAIRNAALFSQGVQFTATVDGLEKLRIPAAADALLHHPRRVERVVACLGDAIREHLMVVDAREQEVGVSGYLADPIFTRRDHRGIHLAVNGRPVQDRELIQVVKMAYRPVLDPGRQPVCVLNLQVPSPDLDVNVHPQKAEVRLLQRRGVHAALLSTLTRHLASAGIPNRVSVQSVAGRMRARLAGVDSDKEAAPPQRVYTLKKGAQTAVGPTAHRSRHPSGRGLSGPGSLPAAPAAGAPTRAANFRLVARCPGNVALVANATALFAVDLNKAARQAFAQKFPGPKRPLIFPDQIDVAPDLAEWVGTRGESLSHFGFDATQFGPQSLMLKAIPTGVDGKRARAAFMDLLDLFRAKGLAEMPAQTQVLRALEPHLSGCQSDASDSEVLELVSATLRGAPDPDNTEAEPDPKLGVVAVPWHRARSFFGLD
jgi:DNA mismatch repair protein MutL